MDRAMSYLTSRDRTKSEMLKYLADKGFDAEETAIVIARLEELGLVDDENYAEGFVRSRLASKPHSKSSLYRQLSAHHVPEAIIDSVLDNIPEDSDFENALSVASKFCRQFRALEPDLRRRRVLTRLQSRGYTYEISRRAYECAENSLKCEVQNEENRMS